MKDAIILGAVLIPAIAYGFRYKQVHKAGHQYSNQAPKEYIDELRSVGSCVNFANSFSFIVASGFMYYKEFQGALILGENKKVLCTASMAVLSWFAINIAGGANIIGGTSPDREACDANPCKYSMSKEIALAFIAAAVGLAAGHYISTGF